MAIEIKRIYLDFVARDYTTKSRKVEIISAIPKSSSEQFHAKPAQWEKGKAFTLRCYLSLQGEANPATLSGRLSSAEHPVNAKEQTTYRYEWTFGITLIEEFSWDWMKELPDESALAIHVVLKPEPFEDGPEAIPIGAILSTLHPSRNTKSMWEQALPLVPKTAAEMAKTGASAFPLLNYLSSGLMLGSNVLASYTDNQKNWFLYQFFDEKQQCPVVEWRINKKVLVEYGPLIRGTLFLAFPNSVKSKPGTVRMLLRPQIRYHQEDELTYLVPTYAEGMGPDNQVFINIRPTELEEPSI